MTLNCKNIFLVDAAGAGISAVVIGLILPYLNSWVGLPVQALYFLATLALAYAVYSFYCYWFSFKTKAFLYFIILANLVYCILTAAIVAYYFKEMMILGYSYFLAEIFVILTLVTIEYKVYQKT